MSPCLLFFDYYLEVVDFLLERLDELTALEIDLFLFRDFLDVFDRLKVWLLPQELSES
jgi:hypothetical protein